MTIKIDPKKAYDKINIFISEVDELQKESYVEGKEKYYGLDTRIRNFIDAAFSDNKQKKSSYSGIFFAVGGHTPTPQEEQEDYLQDLKRTKRHLMAWKEEIELCSEISSESNELSKIEQKIEQSSKVSSESGKVNKLKEQIEENSNVEYWNVEGEKIIKRKI